MIATTSDGVGLWWEQVGVGPAVLLIPGRGDSADLFPRLFVERLLAAGLSVIRMDPRDTGLSEDGGDEYTLSTMASDIITVLDASNVGSAHTAAVSMGGLITVDLASRFPDRVLTSTFIAAMSPDPDAGMGPDFFSPLGSNDRITTLLSLMGSPSQSDRDWIVSEIEHSSKRSPVRPDAGQRHMDASLRFGWPELHQLDEFHSPALVIHGTADLVLPAQHGKALASSISGSDLHLIDGMGHLPTKAEWERIAELTAAHIAA